MRGHEKPIHRGELPKRVGGLEQFADLKESLAKKEGAGCFWGVIDTPNENYVISVNLRAGEILCSVFSTLWWTLELRVCKEHAFLKIKISLRLLVCSYWLKDLSRIFLQFNHYNTIQSFFVIKNLDRSKIWQWCLTKRSGISTKFFPHA